MELNTAQSGVAQWRELFAGRARADIGDEIARIMALAGRTDIISFAGGFPDPAALDRGALARIVTELVASGDLSPFLYAPTRGLPGLRDYIAKRLETLEGLAVGDDELLITSGGVEALQLVGMVFLDAGDTIVVEAPTYLGAQMSFASYGANVVTVPLDDDGLDVDALAGELARGLRPKVVYTIPDHQNPAGATLSAERRRSLVGLATRYGFLVVEDVAYREFAFDPEPLPCLWALAPQAVLQIGTFSKIFAPGVRLGWAVGPAEVVERLTWAKQLTDQCASAFAQRLVEEYGRRGHLDVQVARAKSLYRGRGEAMLECLDAEMPADVRWTRPHGGFFTWLTLSPGDDAAEVVARGADAGVAVVPGIPFFPDERGRHHLRVCFSRSGIDEIHEGVRRLGALLRRS